MRSALIQKRDSNINRFPPVPYRSKPAGSKKTLHLIDLKDETFIMFAEETLLKAIDNLTEAFQSIAAVPYVIQVDNILSQRIMVKLNQRITVGTIGFGMMMAGAF